jgi:hypothetical protein
MFSNVVYGEDPNIRNDCMDANQLAYFSGTLSENIFNFTLEPIITNDIQQIDEDDKFFGTRITEAKNILKALFTANK